MYLTTTKEGKVPAGVSIRRYTLAQSVVILVPCSGVRCSLEAQEREAEKRVGSPAPCARRC